MKELNDDLLDDGLQGVMGKDRCRDMTSGKQIKKKVSKDTPVDASWIPVTEAGVMSKVKACAKWALLFAAISGLLFYWQQAGLLAPSAAVPSLIFCALGAGLTVGYNARG